MGFNLDFVIRNLPVFTAGLWMTLVVSTFGLLVAAPAGLATALGMLRGGRGLATAMRGYVQVFRNTPLLVQLYLVYFGMPLVGLAWDPTASGIVALGLYHGAFLAEVFRAGLGAISGRQLDAAASLGMRYPLALRRILLPQAIRLILPALGNEFVLLVKNSSLLSTIAIVELTMTGKLLADQSAAVYEVFFAVGAFYLVVTSLMGLALRRVEWRLRMAE
jgi:polar amino acid transport system permease protein